MAAICSTCGNILQADGNFYCAHCACVYYNAWNYQNPQPAAYPAEQYNEVPFTQRQEQVQPFNHLLDQPQFASQSMEPHFLQPQQYQTASSNPYDGDTFYSNTSSSGSVHASYVNGNQNQYYAEHNSCMSLNQSQQPMNPGFEAQYMVPNMQPQEIETAFPDQSFPVLQCKEEVKLPGTAEFGEFQGSWSAGQSQGFQQLNSVGQHPSEHLPNLNNQNVANFYAIQAYNGFSGRENQTNKSNLSKESQNESKEQSQGNGQEETGFRFGATPVPFSDFVDDPTIHENPEWNEELVVEQKEAHGGSDSSGVRSLKRKREQDPQEAKSDSDWLKKGVKQTSEKLNSSGGYCAAESCNKNCSNINEHQYKRNHPRLQKCSILGCRYFYPSWEERREHERKKHRERKELRCAHCHYSTENKHRLKRHIKKHFRPPICSVRKTPACPHCEFFSKTSSVKRHMNSSKHRNEEKGVPTRKKFCCSKCEFSSFEITDVTNHIETQHPLEYINDDNEE